MKNNRKLIFLIVLSAVWIAMVEKFDLVNIILAISIGIVIYYMNTNYFNSENIELMKFRKSLKYVIFIAMLLTHVYKASFYYIKSIISGVTDEDIVTIYLHETDDFDCFLIATAITLTPGTVSVNLINKQLEVLILDRHRDERDLLGNVRTYEEILK